MNAIYNLSFKEYVVGIGSLITLDMGYLFAHEYSHMTAMRALFTNIDPYVGCDFSGCFAAWNGKPAIRPELLITDETGRGIVSAAGPISNLTIAAISSMIAWKTLNSNKKISLLFGTHAFISALDTFAGAMFYQGPNGDFARVESYLGISQNIQSLITGSVFLGVTMLGKHILFSEKPMEIYRKKNT